MESYVVKELKNGKFILCKILNEYEDKKEANRDMIKVATDAISEKELLKEYNKKKL